MSPSHIKRYYILSFNPCAGNIEFTNHYSPASMKINRAWFSQQEKPAQSAASSICRALFRPALFCLAFFLPLHFSALHYVIQHILTLITMNPQSPNQLHVHPAGFPSRGTPPPGLCQLGSRVPTTESSNTMHLQGSAPQIIHCPFYSTPIRLRLTHISPHMTTSKQRGHPHPVQCNHNQPVEVEVPVLSSFPGPSAIS